MSRRFESAVLAMLAVQCLTSNCGGLANPQLRVEIVDFQDLAPLGDLRVRVCSHVEMDLSELRVNFYVTESDAWRESEGNPPYTEFIRQPYVGIPGAVSAPIPHEWWRASSNGCYEAVLPDVLINAQDWIDLGVCPFKAIVAVADYHAGARNDADIRKCELPD